MSVQINFPISACPYCKNEEFHNNIGMHGVTKVTYDNKGNPIKTKVEKIHYTGVRDTWYCSKCDEPVFSTKDCS